MTPEALAFAQRNAREHMAIHDRLPRPLRDLNNQVGIAPLQATYPALIYQAFREAAAAEPDLFHR